MEKLNKKMAKALKKTGWSDKLISHFIKPDFEQLKSVVTATLKSSDLANHV
jgi:3-methyladenine DNA glycosylase Tag